LRSARLVKAHAYGNDFLIAPEPLAPGTDEAAFARAVCHRHHGIGADGLMFVQRHGGGARMRLFNADGSRSEVSGNGGSCMPEAPVGHRQPRAANVGPVPKDNLDALQERVNKQNNKLNLCRGC